MISQQEINIRIASIQKLQNPTTITKRILELIVEYKNEAFEFYTQKAGFVASLTELYDTIKKSFPHESMLQNCIHILEKNVQHNSMNEIDETTNITLEYIMNHVQSNSQIIAHHAFKKIKKNIFVFGHSHTIYDTILYAHTKGIDCHVHICEAKPSQSGLRMAKELAKFEIPITLYPDSAMRSAIKSADIVFLQTHQIDAYLKFHSIVGSELVCEIAKKLGKPVYILADSFKFNPRIKSIPSGHNSYTIEEEHKFIQLFSHKFEMIHPDKITGVISELGIYPAREFEHKCKEKHPLLFL